MRLSQVFDKRIYFGDSSGVSRELVCPVETYVHIHQNIIKKESIILLLPIIICIFAINNYKSRLLQMKRSLAKLLLGTDVHEDYSVAEHENLASKSRIEKLTQDFEPLKAQKEKIARDTEIANTKLSSLQQQLQSIEDRIRQRLENEELKTKRQKKSLEDDIKTLNQTITELKKQVEKRDDKRQQATNKLPQRREIKNRLTTLKDEWNEKLTTFQERTNSTDKATLLALQTELEGYYRIINNAINTPSE